VYGIGSSSSASVGAKNTIVQPPPSVTRSFSRFLVEELGWVRIEALDELRAGDLLFSTDAPCCPGYPNHVAMFDGWSDARRAIAWVIDNQGFHVARPLIPAEGSEVDGFGYALRAPSSGAYRGTVSLLSCFASTGSRGPEPAGPACEHVVGAPRAGRYRCSDLELDGGAWNARSVRGHCAEAPSGLVVRRVGFDVRARRARRSA